MAEITKKTKAFAKALIDAKIIKPCLRNKEVLKSLQEITELPSQKLADDIGDPISMLYHEYSDWVETYVE